MENNLARARARKAAATWADWKAPTVDAGDSPRAVRIEAFEAGAAWAEEQAISAASEAEVNEIVASLVRDAQRLDGDEAADHAAKRIGAYFAGVHGAEQDLWAIERATGQRQLDEAGALIREAAALLRGYESHHRDKRGALAMAHGAHSPEFLEATEKIARNGGMAARLEAWLAGAPLPGSMEAADQAAQEAFVSAQLDAGIDQIGEGDEPAHDPDLATGCADDHGPLAGVFDRDKPLIVPPAPRHHRAPADLVAAMAGATLIEEGVGWVKVHGLANARALFDCLAAANAVAQGGAVWRLEGAADLAAFRLTTGDPRFDPRKPATINGFLYHPTKED